jgi:cell division transport system permease protein
VRLLWLGGTGLLALIVVLTVFSSTRLVLSARREEMEICSILGATPLFTKVPFYMESLLVGSASGVFASASVATAVSFLKRTLPVPIAAALPWHGPEVFLLTVALVACGVAVSSLGSWLAFRRVLRTGGAYVASAEDHAQHP